MGQFGWRGCIFDWTGVTVGMRGDGMCNVGRCIGGMMGVYTLGNVGACSSLGSVGTCGIL